MIYRILADGVVIFHFAFVLFVLFGGLLVLRWPRLRYAHIPAALWGVTVEFSGWLCPLTPLEQKLDELGGGDAYAGGFVDHYIWPLLYTEDLLARYEIDFRTFQIVVGSVVILLNVSVYGWLIWKWVRRRRGRAALTLAPAATVDLKAVEDMTEISAAVEASASAQPLATGATGRDREVAQGLLRE